MREKDALIEHFSFFILVVLLNFCQGLYIMSGLEHIIKEANLGNARI